MTKVQNDSLRFDEKTAPDNFLQRAQIFTLIWWPNLTTLGFKAKKKSASNLKKIK